MKRLSILALAVPAVLWAGLALGPGHVRAGEQDEEQKKVEKQVVVRHAGGGRLGVVLADTEGDVRGAKVRSVEEGSAAEKAGIKDDDVVVRFDGEAVRSASHLARLVGETPAGRAVPIEVTRGGATQKLTATLAEGNRGASGSTPEGCPACASSTSTCPSGTSRCPSRPRPPHAPSAPRSRPMPPHAPTAPHVWSWKGDDGSDMVFRMLGGGPRRLGVEYMEIGEQLASYFKLSGKTGVLVSSVDADGPAAKGGMKAGDVILKVGTEAIEDGEDLREAVAEAEGGKEITVTVQRDGRPLDLKVTLGEAGDEGEAPVGRRQPVGEAAAPVAGTGARPPAAGSSGRGRSASTSSRSRTSRVPPATSAGPRTRFARGTSRPTIPARPKPMLSAPPRAVPAALLREGQAPSGQGGVGHLEGDRAPSPGRREEGTHDRDEAEQEDAGSGGEEVERAAERLAGLPSEAPCRRPPPGPAPAPRPAATAARGSARRGRARSRGPGRRTSRGWPSRAAGSPAARPTPARCPARGRSGPRRRGRGRRRARGRGRGAAPRGPRAGRRTATGPAASG